MLKNGPKNMQFKYTHKVDDEQSEIREDLENM